MIEMLRQVSDGSRAQLVLHPPRGLGARQFVLLFAALAGLMAFSAGLGWLSGNVFAPAFALLHGLLVGAALRASWRSGERRNSADGSMEILTRGLSDSEIRALTDLPLGVGFGIKDPATAAAVAQVADAVVVGSALVSKMGELADDPERMRREVSGLLGAMRRAMSGMSS